MAKKATKKAPSKKTKKTTKKVAKKKTVTPVRKGKLNILLGGGGVDPVASGTEIKGADTGYACFWFTNESLVISIDKDGNYEVAVRDINTGKFKGEVKKGQLDTSDRA